jgi:hypothetical protein
MPNFDGTGPRGQGPLTGRGLGPCGYRGRMSFGGGYGYGRRFISPKNELAALEDDKEALKKELEEINNEIADLKKQDK